MQICPRVSDVAAVKRESCVEYIPGYLNFYISLYFLPFFFTAASLACRAVSELSVHKKKKGCFACVVGQKLGVCSFCSEKPGMDPAGVCLLLSHSSPILFPTEYFWIFLPVK